jgi:hypothetical protein
MGGCYVFEFFWYLKLRLHDVSVCLVAPFPLAAVGFRVEFELAGYLDFGDHSGSSLAVLSC